MLQQGKRYVCEVCGLEAMVTKGSDDGTLRCCETEMVLQQPRAVASSD